MSAYNENSDAEAADGGDGRPAALRGDFTGPGPVTPESSTRHEQAGRAAAALLRHPGIWRGEQSRPARGVLPTGFAPLDMLLGGGWPLGTLSELLLEEPGSGELGLLLPSLCRLARSGTAPRPRQWLMLIAPPYLPYAPALAQHGLELSGVLLVRCRDDGDTLWAMEQALRSATCAAVLGWVAGDTDPRALRRLQLAAAESGPACSDACGDAYADTGGVLAVLCRPARCARERSAAALRMRLRPAAGGCPAQGLAALGAAALRLEVLKRRGGGPGSVTVEAALDPRPAEPGA